MEIRKDYCDNKMFERFLTLHNVAHPESFNTELSAMIAHAAANEIKLADFENMCTLACLLIMVLIEDDEERNRIEKLLFSEAIKEEADGE